MSGASKLSATLSRRVKMPSLRMTGGLAHGIRCFSTETPPKFSSSIFTEPADQTIDMHEFDARSPRQDRSNYRGSLVIVPTPLGNLGDISLRQFEALTVECDIIACEDTRKTGKML